MPILDAVKERLAAPSEAVEPRAAQTIAVKDRVAPTIGAVVSAIRLGLAWLVAIDLVVDHRLIGAIRAVRRRLAPAATATKDRLAPVVGAMNDRLAPVAAAARERLAPIVQPLSPVIDRVRETAAELRETTVGAAPDTELVPDPVGDLRHFFGVQDTGIIAPLPRELESAETVEPPHESWALSTLDPAEERAAAVRAAAGSRDAA